MRRFVDINGQSSLKIQNASVPLCCIPADVSVANPTIDSLALVDIDIAEGKVTNIYAARGSPVCADGEAGIVDLRRGLVLPTFVDLHTHIGNHLDRRTRCQTPCANVSSNTLTVSMMTKVGGSPTRSYSCFLQTRLRQENAVATQMALSLGLTAAQPAMLNSGIRKMCTGAHSQKVVCAAIQIEQQHSC